MVGVETTGILEAENGTAVAGVTRAEGWEASSIAADIATLGAGTGLAGLINLVLVFLVPRLLSVEDYGYWRIFGLYAGYVGFFHLGFADGALLRWAGRPLREFRQEVFPSFKFLFWQHVAVLTPLIVILGLLLPPRLRFVGLAVAVYAPLFNLTALVQFSLQGARIFRPVAISAMAPPALFCGFVLVWRLLWRFSYKQVISFYLLAWCVPLVFLLFWMKPWSEPRHGRIGYRTLKNCLISGWPIMLANTGVNLIQCADRLAISWGTTIQNFAQYSLAASAMAVPITAIQACSKVFFSHLASLTSDGRRRIYGLISMSLLLVWAVLLPYYFALDAVVNRFLPKYVPSLEYARVLLLGIPFLAGIQILQMSFAYLHGMQTRFLVRTLLVLTVSLGLISLVVFRVGSLRMAAVMQVTIVAGWWLLNEWTLRDLTNQTASHWFRFLSVFALAGLSYWLTSWPGVTLAVTIPLYYLSVAALAGVACRDELRFFFTRLPIRRAPVVQG